MSLSPLQVGAPLACEVIMLESLKQIGFQSSLDEAGPRGHTHSPSRAASTRGHPPPFSGGLSEKCLILMRLAHRGVLAALPLPPSIPHARELRLTSGSSHPLPPCTLQYSYRKSPAKGGNSK